ncbi:hypothetical protein R0K30_21875, partial [Bacillus sp. SIMBA_154]|uniref:sensor histidine kinase n=1 Tax=Bacillus sp. SIMBA_154 TaxID=3080859 RepID=UPI00397BF00F
NLQPDHQLFSVDQALQPLAERYQIMAKEKHLQLNYHKSSALVNTDRKLLTRAVQNLLSNALRYTEKGRIVLGFRRHQNSLTICISDTGSG